MKTFRLSLLTPEGVVYQGDVSYLQMRSSSGSFGVLANHQPMAADCPPGTLRATAADGAPLAFDCDYSVFTMDGGEASVLTSFAHPSANT